MATKEQATDARVSVALRKALAGARVEVKLTLHSSGCELQPEVEVTFPQDTSARQRNAALLLLAAQVELRTPPQEHWLVESEVLDDGNRGRIYLVLLGVGGPWPTHEEAERGLQVLHSALR
ncbi:hypothetical protein [Myxococcus sp. NMCA1]|uniref:hypothetical protein n=1 Tax=Myxococcus sp. NMCA1 TaxID=2996785 RepID=UPI0022869C81|nr:hypothetical protein [Myxococcus sp. NMCA1]WAM28283.1 hypothetical protein OZ403_09250 [Myxococcus sp. NMCA1]